jgi:hypothetical protein
MVKHRRDIRIFGLFSKAKKRYYLCAQLWILGLFDQSFRIYSEWLIANGVRQEIFNVNGRFLWWCAISHRGAITRSGSWAASEAWNGPVVSSRWNLFICSPTTSRSTMKCFKMMLSGSVLGSTASRVLGRPRGWGCGVKKSIEVFECNFKERTMVVLCDLLLDFVGPPICRSRIQFLDPDAIVPKCIGLCFYPYRIQVNWCNAREIDMATPAAGEISEIKARFDNSGAFSVTQLKLEAEDIEFWVEFVTNPPRFTAAIFEGNWARADNHPRVGIMRVLRAIRGRDDVIRLVGRQESRIFAGPWIDWEIF